MNELNNPKARSYIGWTGVEGEFKLRNPSEVARRWGMKKNVPKMNYEKLSRSLRYYYDKNILTKVLGKRYVYRFSDNIIRRFADQIRQSVVSSNTSSTESVIEDHPCPQAGKDKAPVKVEFTPGSQPGDEAVDMTLNHLNNTSTDLATPKWQPVTSDNGGMLQLWRFLMNELHDPEARSYIGWTGMEGEFKLKNPPEVARRWGLKKNLPKMNYEKLSRSLRYYYDKNVLRKVPEKRYVYRFSDSIMRRFANWSSTVAEGR
ncbi:hypothetical protein Aperf_G00000073981 [Anoplocephala perfoliata]